MAFQGQPPPAAAASPGLFGYFRNFGNAAGNAGRQFTAAVTNTFTKSLNSVTLDLLKVFTDHGPGSSAFAPAISEFSDFITTATPDQNLEVIRLFRNILSADPLVEESIWCTNMLAYLANLKNAGQLFSPNTAVNVLGTERNKSFINYLWCAIEASPGSNIGTLGYITDLIFSIGNKVDDPSLPVQVRDMYQFYGQSIQARMTIPPAANSRTNKLQPLQRRAILKQIQTIRNFQASNSGAYDNIGGGGGDPNIPTFLNGPNSLYGNAYGSNNALSLGGYSPYTNNTAGGYPYGNNGGGGGGSAGSTSSAGGIYSSLPLESLTSTYYSKQELESVIGASSAIFSNGDWIVNGQNQPVIRQEELDYIKKTADEESNKTFYVGIAGSTIAGLGLIAGGLGVWSAYLASKHPPTDESNLTDEQKAIAEQSRNSNFSKAWKMILGVMVALALIGSLCAWQVFSSQQAPTKKKILSKRIRDQLGISVRSADSLTTKLDKPILNLQEAYYNNFGNSGNGGQNQVSFGNGYA